MKLLVYGKADVNLADGKSGRTPLHHAVETDDLSLAAYLILQVYTQINETENKKDKIVIDSIYRQLKVNG